MNLREGTRRLALLLGAAGAIFGGFLSHLELQSLIRQRAEHRQFERLENSQGVQKVRNRLIGTIATAAKTGIEVPPNLPPATVDAFIAAPEPRQREALDKMSVPAKEALLAALKKRKADGLLKKRGSVESEVHNGGIGTITWSAYYRIASITTEDGQTLFPTPAPAAWSYVLIAIFPLLGFIIPWGVIGAVAWAAAGFVQPVK